MQKLKNFRIIIFTLILTFLNLVRLSKDLLSDIKSTLSNSSANLESQEFENPKDISFSSVERFKYSIFFLLIFKNYFSIFLRG